MAAPETREQAIERLGHECAEQLTSALVEVFDAARDLGTVTAAALAHDEEEAQSSIVLDACAELLGAVYAATGRRFAIVEPKEGAAWTAQFAPFRVIEDGGTIGGVMLAEGGMFCAFGGMEPMFRPKVEVEFVPEGDTALAWDEMVEKRLGRSLSRKEETP
jgi:hypothetical protein